jgi:hypothetical protein
MQLNFSKLKELLKFSKGVWFAAKKQAKPDICKCRMTKMPFINFNLVPVLLAARALQFGAHLGRKAAVARMLACALLSFTKLGQISLTNNVQTIITNHNSKKVNCY